MAGIIAAGAYIPRYRLPRELIAKEWGGPSSGGEKAVANHDEDSLTLAVNAALTLPSDGKTIDAVVFATTTSPYTEKQGAATIATVLDLVVKRIVVFDMVHRTVLMDCTDPENPAFESVRCVAKFRPDHGGLEERAIEGYYCFAVRLTRLEMWFSEELDEPLILMKTSDDAETRYRLFDIKVNDPDDSLFVLPGAQSA